MHFENEGMLHDEKYTNEKGLVYSKISPIYRNESDRFIPFTSTYSLLQRG